MPVALTNRHNMNENSALNTTVKHIQKIKDDSTRILHIFAKNCRGLGSADRFDELMEDLQKEQWDIVLVNETWRTDKEEYWVTEDKHIFAGAGHDCGRKGVGILVHERWSKNILRFKLVSERVCFLDVKIFGMNLRFVSVYFPDNTYPDAEVQQVYDTLSEIRREALKTRYKLVIAGDFNAKVGDEEGNKAHSSCGSFGYGTQNSRGQWLLTWSSVKALKIANTMFRKQDDKLRTHLSAQKTWSQLDYILVDKWLNSKLQDVETANAIDLGSDHVCLKAVLKFEHEFQKRRKEKERKIRPAKAAWPPQSLAVYTEKLEELLKDVRNDEAVHEKYLKTQEALIKASLLAACSDISPEAEEEVEVPVLRKLIVERKSLPASDTERRCQVSKEIRKEVKKLKAEQRAAKINTILKNFSKIAAIKAIKSRRKMDLTIGMLDAEGTLKHDKKSIVEVFAKFYEQLYSSHVSKGNNKQTQGKDVKNAVPKFTEKDLDAGLHCLKEGKAKDGKGFLAEMLKVKSHKLRKVLLELMNAIIEVDAPTPTEWHENVLKILFKGGDSKQAKNYRPICVMPVLYKLFAVMLQKRLTPTLEAALTKEQAGFRKKFSTVDHLHTLMQIQEKTAEWQIPLWTCFIDFEKAFDSIEHDAIWAALQRQGVSDGYIEVLQRMYKGQTSQVSVDAMLSRSFEIQRGTKQGDPLSTLLFNAVLEDAFREVRTKWKRKRYGLEMSVGSTSFLTSLCFADDVVLIATSSKHLKEMLGDLKRAALARGLKVHSGKTKVLTNEGGASGRSMIKQIDIDGEKYEVLAKDASTKYLGRKVNFEDPQGTEFDNRIAAAWGAFSKHKEELTDMRYRIKDRLRLFEAVVTPSLLYGCEAWALKVEQEKRLKTIQRKMLRLVLNAKRRTKDEVLESWPEFLKRTAQKTDELLERGGLQQWAEKWRTRKWRWAQKLFTEADGKWSRVATVWNPFLHSSYPRGRKQARPKKRWEEDIQAFIRKDAPEERRHWHELAKDVKWWSDMEKYFAQERKSSEGNE